jgi:hypothetical protein
VIYLNRSSLLRAYIFLVGVVAVLMSFYILNGDYLLRPPPELLDDELLLLLPKDLDDEEDEGLVDDEELELLGVDEDELELLNPLVLGVDDPDGLDENDRCELVAFDKFLERVATADELAELLGDFDTRVVVLVVVVVLLMVLLLPYEEYILEWYAPYGVHTHGR